MVAGPRIRHTGVLSNPGSSFYPSAKFSALRPTIFCTLQVSQVMGFVKGKSAIDIARVYVGKKRNFVGQHFWARGYWVSTVGKNEAAVRPYIQEQEKEDQRLDQLEMFGALSASR